MATDILSDIFALGNIRCFSHMVTGSPHELGIKTWWETPASCHHHSRAYLQLGHGMAYPWRTCGLSHLQFSPKLVEISQNPLGTSHPSGELPLAPSLSVSLQQGWQTTLLWLWVTQLSSLKLSRMSFDREVENSRCAKSCLERRFRCLLYMTQWCKPTVAALVVPRYLTGAVTKKWFSKNTKRRK